jgi:hypothetical protein
VINSPQPSLPPLQCGYNLTFPITIHSHCQNKVFKRISKTEITEGEDVKNIVPCEQDIVIIKFIFLSYLLVIEVQQIPVRRYTLIKSKERRMTLFPFKMIENNAISQILISVIGFTNVRISRVEELSN